MDLRLHSFLKHSRANGPGVRAVVWTQGCSLGCPGCFNPLTHDGSRGKLISVDQLAAQILELGDAIEGVTVSGGEPLQQFDAVLALLRKLRAASDLSAIVFTGFAWPEIARMPRHRELLACVDVLLAGRYDAHRRVAKWLVGSANKTLHFLSQRYADADFRDVPEAEILIDADGSVSLSGINPVVLTL